MKQFFGSDFNTNRMVIKEGDTLGLGRHELTFVAAPMVHWPEVMVTYDACDQILFSADGFGKFGALDEEEAWTDGARRYYFGIVGRFGMQAQNLLKKASGLTIQKICPLHGPVLSENLACYLSLYNTWSSYQPEEKDVYKRQDMNRLHIDPDHIKILLESCFLKQAAVTKACIIDKESHRLFLQFIEYPVAFLLPGQICHNNLTVCPKLTGKTSQPLFPSGDQYRCV